MEIMTGISCFTYVLVLFLNNMQEDMMDKYEDLINLFSDVLEQSKDYHIAYIYEVGYASVIGVYDITDAENKQPVTIDEIFQSSNDMAESLLRNWKWQWLYKHKQIMKLNDYEDISQMDNDMDEPLKTAYHQQLKEIEKKVNDILLN